jgi:hypothetical protein
MIAGKVAYLQCVGANGNVVWSDGFVEVSFPRLFARVKSRLRNRTLAFFSANYVHVKPVQGWHALGNRGRTNIVKQLQTCLLAEGLS